ncbi:MAG TPA: ABC transporter permease [Candidatus Acidoferrales bacterium]|nr:ABC transporter permease [Candidatus Acidoferrales bacterium]
MKTQRKLWGALILLAGLHGLVLFAGFFAPYSSSAQDRELPFAPPTRIHFIDAQGTFHARPFVYGLKDDPKTFGSLAADSTQMYPLHFFVRGSSYKVACMFESNLHLFGVSGTGRIFLMGSDGYGRDQFTRFLYGGQISLAAGLIAAALSVLLGIIIGALAGFYGGWIDDVLMRGGELFLALPWLYLLFAVRAALPLHIAQWQVFLLLIAVIGLVGWARPARLIRGMVLSAKERNFVVAARTFGASDAYLLRRHVLPQTYGVILTQVALLVPQYVLAEVTLTFLGLGVGEPMPSWGSLLASLQQYYVLSSYWWMFLPALLLVPVFLAYYMAADALQERLKTVPL